MRAFYPVMLDVYQKKCLIVGGGKVGERKLGQLLEAGAWVTVISPVVTERMVSWLAEGLLEVRLKPYQTEDLEGAFLVIAASDKPEVNQRVYADAVRRNILCNIADKPESSDFHNMAVLRRGKLHIAVSTSGASPFLARQILGRLERDYGEEYESWLDFLSEIREKIKQTVDDPLVRSRLFESISKWDILGKIREGTFAAFREEILERIELGNFQG